MTEPNRISPDGGPVATTAEASQRPVGAFTASSPPRGTPVGAVPSWVRWALSALIPMLGGAAITPGVPPIAQLVCGFLTLGAGGLAAHLGMTVGAPKQ